MYLRPVVMCMSVCVWVCGLQVYLANLNWWATDVEVETLCKEFGEVGDRMQGG